MRLTQLSVKRIRTDQVNKTDKECIVVAVFEPGPEHRDEVRELLMRVTPTVHEEPGCVFYTMNEDSEGRFVHIEAWETRQHWLNHMKHESVAEILSGVEGKLTKDITVYELYNVPTGQSGMGSIQAGNR